MILRTFLGEPHKIALIKRFIAMPRLTKIAIRGRLVGGFCRIFSVLNEVFVPVAATTSANASFKMREIPTVRRARDERTGTIAKGWGSRMTNLFKGEIGKLFPLLAALDEAGLSAGMMEVISVNHSDGDNSLARAMLAAYAAALAEAGKISIETFVQFVQYIKPPFEKLSSMFGSVNPNYATVQIKPIEPCKNVDRSNRKVTFRLFRIARTMTTKEVIALIKAAGFRPALYEELVAVLDRCPWELSKARVVAALGSVAKTERGTRTPYASNTCEGRQLDLSEPSNHVADVWSKEWEFLVVEDR